MSQRLEPLTDVTISAENIGGITKASGTICPGVTVLVGKNATNRTSFLQSIAAALGTDYCTLKRDADAGKATLTVGNETYTRTIERTNGHVETGGNPYLDCPDLAELYAVLFETNEVRRAIRNGGDLRELIVRPLDIEQINEQIGKLVEERRRIDEQLEEYDRISEKLTARQSKREQYRSRLEDIETRLEEKRSALDAVEQRDDASEVESKLDSKLDVLHETQAALEEVRENLAIEQKSLESLREERKSLATEYEELEPPEPERVATLEERLARLREQKRSLESTISELQKVIRFNEERLQETESSLLAPSGEKTDVVDGLDPDSADTVCWTCGTEVSQDSIEGTLDRLRTLRQEQSTERNEIATEIDEITDTLSTLEEARERHDRLESRLAETDENIERRESTVGDLQERKRELEARVEEYETAVERLKTDRQSEVLELQEQVSELEFERERVREQLDELNAEIETLREQSADRETLVSQRDAISQELTELRTRVEQIETEAIESFNDHMAAVLAALEYDNIERIWLEATQESIDDSDRTVTERVFDLHIVRKTDDGTLYEDSVAHLSESERELVGLMVALSGYLVHDVQQKVPFMLLDSLEMIDGERLVALAEYLEQYVPYLVLVLLPDHAEAFTAHESLPDHTITEI